MTLAIVDPLGDYNTDNSTSWLAHDTGSKCVYLPSAGEFWFLLETGPGPSAPSGTRSSNSHLLRVDETTGDYIAMADDPAGQSGKLYLWGALIADEVNQLVLSTGQYVTTSGGTTIGGNAMIAWNYDGTVAWEQFWANEFAGFFYYRYVEHFIYNPTLGTLYCVQNSDFTLRRLQSINLATGARTTKATYRDVSGSYRPVMDNAGDVWVGYAFGSTEEQRHTLTGTPSVTTIEAVPLATGIVQRQAYDEINDIAYWFIEGTDVVNYWDGSSVVSAASTTVAWDSAGGIYQNAYEQFVSRTGYWTFTLRTATARDAYYLDLLTFSLVKQVTEPADVYASDYAAGELKYQFTTNFTRAWWRIKDTTWKFLVWTEAATRRRVSVCVIT